MSTALTSYSIATQAAADAESHAGFRWAISDTSEMVKRNFRHIARSPELLLDVTVQPVIFVVPFVYILSGAYGTPRTSYGTVLEAGTSEQSVNFCRHDRGIRTASGPEKGLNHRLRPFVADRLAEVAGRTITDLLRGML